MLAQGWLRDAEHARNVRFGNAVGGHRLGFPPLRVSRGQDRWSHWKIRPLKSATIIALCIGCTYPPGDWDGVCKNEVTGSNSYSKMVARYRDRLLAAHAAQESVQAESAASTDATVGP